MMIDIILEGHVVMMIDIITKSNYLMMINIITKNTYFMMISNILDLFRVAGFLMFLTAVPISQQYSIEAPSADLKGYKAMKRMNLIDP